jgi:tetratricopeptide (TPR) repeat protein
MSFSKPEGGFYRLLGMVSIRVLTLLVLGGTGLFAASASTSALGDVEGLTQIGRARYEHCEFKAAARAFSRALEAQPDAPQLHHWLGKSYARMAEVSSPLHAARDADRARRSLERAVELDPRNHEYLRELFYFYLDSPEWFGGGLKKAEELVDRIDPEDPGGQVLLRTLVEGARQEYHGATWRIRQSILVPSAQVGRVIP